LELARILEIAKNAETTIILSSSRADGFHFSFLLLGYYNIFNE